MPFCTVLYSMEASEPARCLSLVTLRAYWGPLRSAGYARKLVMMLQTTLTRGQGRPRVSDTVWGARPQGDRLFDAAQRSGLPRTVCHQ